MQNVRNDFQTLYLASHFKSKTYNKSFKMISSSIVRAWDSQVKLVSFTTWYIELLQKQYIFAIFKATIVPNTFVIHVLNCNNTSYFLILLLNRKLYNTSKSICTLAVLNSGSSESLSKSLPLFRNNIFIFTQPHQYIAFQDEHLFNTLNMIYTQQMNDGTSVLFHTF